MLPQRDLPKVQTGVDTADQMNLNLQCHIYAVGPHWVELDCNFPVGCESILRYYPVDLI
jgi:hypothetical protein